MTDDPTIAPDDEPEPAPTEPAPGAHDHDHDHVRTEGETSVDDAIGTSDDPQ